MLFLCVYLYKLLNCSQLKKNLIKCWYIILVIIDLNTNVISLLFQGVKKNYFRLNERKNKNINKIISGSILVGEDQEKSFQIVCMTNTKTQFCINKTWKLAKYFIWKELQIVYEEPYVKARNLRTIEHFGLKCINKIFVLELNRGQYTKRVKQANH